MKWKTSDYWSIGTSVGLCAALGILAGALSDNLVLWLSIGAGIGVVIGAVSHLYKRYKVL
jgi:uncharacterized membrane protein YphA (DoxX/SURF4 family)